MSPRSAMRDKLLALSTRSACGDVGGAEAMQKAKDEQTESCVVAHERGPATQPEHATLSGPGPRHG